MIRGEILKPQLHRFFLREGLKTSSTNTEPSLRSAQLACLAGEQIREGFKAGNFVSDLQESLLDVLEIFIFLM